MNPWAIPARHSFTRCGVQNRYSRWEIVATIFPYLHSPRIHPWAILTIEEHQHYALCPVFEYGIFCWFVGLGQQLESSLSIDSVPRVIWVSRKEREEARSRKEYKRLKSRQAILISVLEALGGLCENSLRTLREKTFPPERSISATTPSYICTKIEDNARNQIQRSAARSHVRRNAKRRSRFPDG